MTPIKYYLSKLAAIFSPECPIYKKFCDGCYESADEYGKFLCEDTRGWFSDGTRCQHLENNKKKILEKLSKKITENILKIGGEE